MSEGRPTEAKASPAQPPATRPRKVPLAVWIALGVVGFHAVLFWLVADKRYLPKARHVPPPPPVNFGGGQQRTVDPRTGVVTTETFYVVSTKLASPAPSASPTASP